MLDTVYLVYIKCYLRVSDQRFSLKNEGVVEHMMGKFLKLSAVDRTAILFEYSEGV